MKNLGLDTLTLFTFFDMAIAEDIIEHLNGRNILDFRDGLKYQAVILAAYGNKSYDEIYVRKPNPSYCIKFDYMYKSYMETNKIEDLDPPKDYNYDPKKSYFTMYTFGPFCTRANKKFDNVTDEFNTYLIKYLEEHKDQIMPITGIRTFGYKNGVFDFNTIIPVNTIAPESFRVFQSIMKKLKTKSMSVDDLLINQYLNSINLKSNNRGHLKLFGVDYNSLNNKEASSLKYTINNVFKNLTSDLSNLNNAYNSINSQCNEIFTKTEINSNKINIDNLDYLEIFKNCIESFSEKEKLLYAPYYEEFNYYDADAGLNDRQSYFLKNIVGKLKETSALEQLITNTRNSARTIIKILLITYSLTGERYNSVYQYDTGIDFTAENSSELFKTIRNDLKKFGIIGFNPANCEMAVSVARDVSVITDDSASISNPPSAELKRSVARLSRITHSYYNRINNVK